MTGDGRDIVVGDTGHMVMFFVKLPEAMLVPDEWTRPVMHMLDPDDYMSLAVDDGVTDVVAERKLSMRFRRVVHDVDAAAEFIEMVPAIAAGLPGLDATRGPVGERFEVVDTVVEVVAAISDVSHNEMSRVVNEALEAIRRIQRAYGGATGRAPAPVSRSSLPPAMMMFVFDPSTSFERRHERPQVFVPARGAGATLADAPTVTDDVVRRLDHLYGELDRRSPFRVGEQLMLEARRFVEDHDDPRSSVAAIATACEVLLDDVLACMLWEDGKRPEREASLFELPLMKRVRSNEFSARLGGDWDVDGDGSIGQWARRVAWRRNNMLHTGEEMTLDDAEDAFDAGFGLLMFLRSELLDAADRYGRTMWMLVGRPDVPDAIRDTHIKPLLDDPTETKWTDSSAHWIRVMRYSRKHGEWGRPANPEDVALVAITYPDGHLVWVVVDERLERGLIVKDPSSWASDEVRSGVAQRKVGDTAQVARITKATSSHDSTVPLPVEGEWVAAYRLLPGRPAMVTGEELDYEARRHRPDR